LTVPQLYHALGGNPDAVDVGSEEIRGRVKSARDRVLDSVCRREKLTPSQLAALPGERLVELVTRECGSVPDKAQLSAGVAEYAAEERA
jgi:hypothetical protein